MDLGSTGWTEFKMTPDVTSYIAENIELFDCETGLIHSHHTLGAFFSGQDTSTLQVEGNDTNCFVSLIVDTQGTYKAAITRKVQSKVEITKKPLGSSYEFFGEGPVCSDSVTTPQSTQIIDNEEIEYFMLDVQVEQVINPLDYLDTRFEEIEQRKKSLIKPVTSKNKKEDDKEFYDWIHSSRKTSAEAKETLYSQPSLFDKDTMDSLVDPSLWQPDPTIIHHLATQMLTCSLFIKKDFDTEKYVESLMAEYCDNAFEDLDEFSRWAESMIDFIINHYNDPDTPADVYDDWDSYIAKIIGALIEELHQYPSNIYIEEYITLLKNRGYE